MSLDPKQLATEAHALKAAGRLEQAIALYRQIIVTAPASAVAEHNLAAALGDSGRWREAEPHIRQAFAKGIDAPESWLVLARCLQSLARLDEAEQAFKEAIRRQPSLYDAYRDLAQLRWMRTGDVAAALAHLENAILAAPADPRLLVVKAQVLEYADDAGASYELLAALASTHPQDQYVATVTSQIAATIGDGATALAHAERAAALAPSDAVMAITLITACLAMGQPERASSLVGELRRQAPDNQHAIALQATAWRLLGDPRYQALYDYDALVSASWLDAPNGWSNLDDYVADLRDGLRAAHGYRAHPFHQSVRHGSQASDILQHDHAAVRALPEALDGPIKRFIAALGQGGDPLRARNTGNYVFQGMWSIRMGAGGFHIDHVHPKGWLSSACYVEVPRSGNGKEGWIKFGQPGVRTMPALEAEYFIEPAPGKLLLFPSYMWHGTVPFTDPSTRLSVAFDLTPA